MSKEIRVALLAIGAIAVSYWGFNFIIGKDLFNKTNFYYAEYDDVGGLKTSTEVRINGVQVGRVDQVNIQLDKKNVLVKFDIDPSIKLPKNTEAYILTESFMGAKAVELRYGDPCSGDDCAKSGDYLQGVSLGMLGSMVPPDEMNSYFEDIKKNMNDILDALNEEMLGEDSNSPLANSMRKLESSLTNVDRLTGNLDRLIAKSSNDIAGSLDHVEKLTGNLADNNEKINVILENAAAFSNQLGDLEIKKTVDELSKTVTALNATVEKANSTFDGVNQLVGGIQNGEGTLGQLFKDPDLYNEFTALSAKADSLINDLQARPYRYVPLKGRRKVKKYDKKDAAEEEKLN